MSSLPKDAGDTKRGGEDSGRSIALQWFGVLAPPIAWLLNLEFGYSLAHAACHGSGMVPVHLASIAALIIAGLGGAVALANWKRSGSDWPGEATGVVQRSRMLAALGLGNAALFLVMIVSQWIPAFVLDPCWRT
jgi:hypothetical protein